MSVEWLAVLAVALAGGLIVWRVLGPLPRVTWSEVWLACPWVDRPTGDWSLTRTICLLAAFAWVHVAENSHAFSWPGAAVFALIMLGAFSKNVGDFRRGAEAIFQRRKSDKLDAMREAPTGDAGGPGHG